MKIGVIVQARMGSTRLPGKVLLDLCGKTVLERVINRLKLSRYADEIIVATTGLDLDDCIEVQALAGKVKCFRGSTEDVLSRYYFAALEYELDIIVRVTSDCPLIDPRILDEMILFYLNNDFEFVTNSMSGENLRTYPRGLDLEIFSLKVLKDAYINAAENRHREHVTLYMEENIPGIYIFQSNKDYSGYRLTLDTPKDFECIHRIYSHFSEKCENFYFKDIVKFLEENPKVHLINKSIPQKKV